MLVRLAVILVYGTGLAQACLCVAPGIKDAERYAEIVFRGKITSFRETGNGTRVTFAVDRVWKGNVGKTFEMPA